MIAGIDHVEFFVGDAQQSSFYLCGAFGFRLCAEGGPETGLTGHRSLLLRQGGVRLVLTSALTATAEAAGYVSRHGDGAAVIAFGTDDARAEFHAAVEQGAAPVREPAEYADAGARVVIAEVAGFGDVVHRFVERHGDPDAFLPGRMQTLAPDPEDGESLFELIDHVAVCVAAGELDRTVAHYEKAFGFAQVFEEYIEVGEQAMNSKVVQSPSGGVTFTILEPDTTRRPGQIDDFIGRHGGAGVQHLAFLAPDIFTAVDRLQQRGARFLATPDGYYDGVAGRIGATTVDAAELRRTNVLIDRDHWGEILQIFTQSMHVRRTYFMEVIERRGARSFGSGNIRALYEAVERDGSSAAAV
ncbi:4-hydroxyphenylpyruvate dioxygenase [Streptomyces sp. RKAG293]|uniref:4-hydroxyphenylpyruvate dioxygenase n=1 Tax=Streptomyces fildesensis TaxID=375757 RepID=A0ABW8CJ40_9ACTN|nr:4-hydroxyphenylpyruvate dioxygenase [Streptomyces sp. RKAG293]MCM2417819.1 4-hydroxyphenylpyruvate dioxygenase [Streptomyces sp. RKAG293]